MRRTSKNLNCLNTSLFEAIDDVGDVQTHSEQRFSVCQKLASQGDHEVSSITDLCVVKEVVLEKTYSRAEGERKSPNGPGSRKARFTRHHNLFRVSISERTSSWRRVEFIRTRRAAGWKTSNSRRMVVASFVTKSLSFAVITILFMPMTSNSVSMLSVS